jgi:predicted O-methyltransferase YrrM
MFELYKNVFKPGWNAGELNEPDELRKKLISDNRIIEVTDMGAGSKKFKSNQRSISAIAKTSVKKKKYARLLSRLIKYFNCKTIAELGTSLGLTTVYLSRSTTGEVYTLEGCPNIHSEAVTNTKACECNNVVHINGHFKHTLPELLNKINKPDFAFIDGWHNTEGSLFLFNTLANNISDKGIIVIDDIHWSREMENAWKIIVNHPAVTATIDIFESGIVFFDKNLARETFILKY